MAMLPRLAAVAGVLLRDGIGLAGMGLLTYGAWCIYEPAGYIVAGLFALAIAVLLTVGGGRTAA